MRTFKLVRSVDVSGVSGTGVVAEGVIFHDNEVALSWFGDMACVSLWHSIEAVEKVHGHEGATRVVFDK